MPEKTTTHSEQDSETIRVALRLLAASNPMDEFPQEANAALTRLVEQLEVAMHRCTFPECVEGEKPERCGRCGDALALQSVTNELARMKEQYALLQNKFDLMCEENADNLKDVERLEEQYETLLDLLRVSVGFWVATPQEFIEAQHPVPNRDKVKQIAALLSNPAKSHDYSGAEWQGEGPEPPWASNTDKREGE